jgi:hypothetical protein
MTRNQTFMALRAPSLSFSKDLENLNLFINLFDAKRPQQKQTPFTT